ncbi:MAG: hypothetical protein ORO03_05075, partial [Alphaproteobacteria bacterium]|nr:hypothetical protein [Alphaproteobacteria bacterium]
SDLDKTRDSGNTAGFVKEGTDIKWKLSEGGVNSVFTGSNLKITFSDVGNLSFNALILENFKPIKSIVFEGRSKIIGQADFSLTGVSLTKVEFASGANVTGLIRIKNDLQMTINDATVPRFMVVDTAGNEAGLNGLTVAGSVTFNRAIRVTNLVIAAGDSAPVNLVMDNAGNSIMNISGDSRGGSIVLVTTGGLTSTGLKTRGGDFTLRSNGTVSLSNLETDGGTLRLTNRNGNISLTTVSTAGSSLVLSNPGGVITATGLIAGQVSYSAERIELTGSISGLRGSAGWVKVNNNSTTLVLGDNATVNSLSLSGSGAVMLEGNQISSGSIEIDSSVDGKPVAIMVARDSELVSQGGGAIIIRAMINDLLARAHGIRFNAGAGGVVQFNPPTDLGGRTKLGWVEIQTGSLNSYGTSISTLVGTVSSLVTPIATDFETVKKRRYGMGAF